MLNTPSLRWQRKHGFFKWNMPPLILHKDTAPYRYGLKTKDLMPNGSTVGQKWARIGLYGALVAIMTIIFMAFSGCAFGAETAKIEGYTADQWADSIYLAEGGAKTRHPYGILAKYKTTTPRQACINTVRNNYKRWIKAGRPGTYLAFLGNRYCPVGAANDPGGLNVNWQRNVQYFLERG